MLHTGTPSGRFLLLLWSGRQMSNLIPLDSTWWVHLLYIPGTHYEWNMSVCARPASNEGGPFVCLLSPHPQSPSLEPLFAAPAAALPYIYSYTSTVRATHSANNMMPQTHLPVSVDRLIYIYIQRHLQQVRLRRRSAERTHGIHHHGAEGASSDFRRRLYRRCGRGVSRAAGQQQRHHGARRHVNQ